MADVITVAVKALAGGLLVVAFALLSESFAPKRFAGLFGAAPAVALASLAVTLLTKSPTDAYHDSLGMIVGCVGMFAYALAIIGLLKRARSLVASLAGVAVWVAVVVAIGVPVL